jgi:O-antigen ligase
MLRYLFSPKIKVSIGMLFALIYYLLSVSITLLVQHGLGAGLQKMIAAPALCMISAYYLKNHTDTFIECLSNLLIVDLGMTTLVFNSFFFGDYFNNDIHLMFIGHVQIAAQLGILGILICFIVNTISGKWTVKSILLLLFSLITMLMSQTVGSYMSIAVIAISLICCNKKKSFRKFFTLTEKWYFIFFVLINVCLFVVLHINYWQLPFSFISLNGRNFIWKQGFYKFLEKPLIGYGVHGVLLKVFWSKLTNSEGMNYAHNQLLQVLLDGGIVLFISFLFMLYYYLKPIDKLNVKVRCFANVCVITIMIVMTVESTFEYHYIIFVISLLAYLPRICNCNNINYLKKGVFGNGIDIKI